MLDCISSTIDISQTVMAIAKMRRTTFADIDIRHRMAPMQTLYSVTLTVTVTFIFKVRPFLVIKLLNILTVADCSRSMTRGLYSYYSRLVKAAKQN